METRKIRSYMWMYPVVLLGALAVLGWGIYRMVTWGEPAILAAGAVSVVVVLVAWVLDANNRAAVLARITRQEELIAPMHDRLADLSILVRQVSEQQLISERAKAIAFRENEREALRRAIREEMARKDWDAALVLANQIEAVFGYRQEANQFREEIYELREAETRRRVGDAIAAIDRLCRNEQWSQALREAEEVMKVFPGDPQAQHLPQDIEIRRQNFKKQLLESWNDAVTRHDVDGSIEILKKLDFYLTPAEAQAMQETARQVFKDKLLLLGQQFTLAVKEHNWVESVRLGETIVREFPNSRMAQEVRDKMDLLRQRASEQETARV